MHISLSAGFMKSCNSTDCDNISIGQMVGTWFKRSNKTSYRHNAHLSSNEESSQISSS